MAFPGSVTPALISSGMTWAQFAGPLGGLSGLLEAVIAAQVATAAPTSATTATATGGGASGGLLAAGTYYFVSTETNAFGETTIGPEGSQLTVGPTNIPRFTFPSLKAGNAARNLYLGAKNGPAGGPYALYAAGIATTTFDAAVAAPSSSYAVAPPAANTTAPTSTNAAGATTNIALVFARSPKSNKMQMAWDFVVQNARNLLRGEPEPYGAALMKLNHTRAAMLCWLQALNEYGVLLDANPGTFHVAQNPIGVPKTVRQWP